MSSRIIIGVHFLQHTPVIKHCQEQAKSASFVIKVHNFMTEFDEKLPL